MTILLPANALSDDPHIRHSRLRDYFCDKDAVARQKDGGWELELEWPGGRERHVDPRLPDALADWADIGLQGMSMARRRSGRMLTALYDTWTLLSWSEWAKRAEPAPGERITVLHIDDHRDLGAPRLAFNGDGLRDLVTGRPFDFRTPSSVLEACESGAVGMGSFLTPFLMEFPNCDVRQLGQAPKVGATVDARFALTTVTDDLLSPGAERPAVRLDPSHGVGPGGYRTTDNLDHWLESIGPGPVLLHIDMDYFNNRYDGDGDWPDRHPRHDPPIDAVLARIDEVTAALKTVELLGRIEDAVVAFSPGFFPGEMWRPAEERLQAGLAVLYG